jgi:hypothetical protein
MRKEVPGNKKPGANALKYFKLIRLEKNLHTDDTDWTPACRQTGTNTDFYSASQNNLHDFGDSSSCEAG